MFQGLSIWVKTAQSRIHLTLPAPLSTPILEFYHFIINNSLQLILPDNVWHISYNQLYDKLSSAFVPPADKMCVSFCFKLELMIWNRFPLARWSNKSLPSKLLRARSLPCNSVSGFCNKTTQQDRVSEQPKNKIMVMHYIYSIQRQSRDMFYFSDHFLLIVNETKNQTATYFITYITIRHF